MPHNTESSMSSFTTTVLVGTKVPPADAASIQINRVSNGWVILGGRNWNQGGNGGPEFVARTPSELCDLVRAWADQQQDGLAVSGGGGGSARA